MIRRRLPWTFAFFALTSLGLGCIGTSIAGNDKPATDTRSVGDFVGVDSRSSLEVTVKQGAEFNIELRVDENLLPLVTTKLSGDTLIVDSTESIDPHVPGPHVIITMPVLERATMSGSGALSVASFESEVPVDLSMSGSGVLSFTGDAPEIHADLSGSGDLDLHGAAPLATFDLSGSGNVTAKSLVSSHATADLSGSGDIVASVDGPVELTLTGSGNIELFGHPEVTKSSDTGSGEVKVH